MTLLFEIGSKWEVGIFRVRGLLYAVSLGFVSVAVIKGCLSEAFGLADVIKRSHE